MPASAGEEFERLFGTGAVAHFADVGTAGLELVDQGVAGWVACEGPVGQVDVAQIGEGGDGAGEIAFAGFAGHVWEFEELDTRG